MKKINFFSFWLLLTVGMATVVFNSCSKDDEDKKDPLTYDEGVVINGVKWATRNVAAPGTFAAKPEDAGMFYQWNRKVAWPATGSSVTDWDNSFPTGTLWEKANDPSPAGWHVPTSEEINTLFDADKVTSEYLTINGIRCIKFTYKATGENLFLPAAGYRNFSDGTLMHAGASGFYWSSTPFEGEGYEWAANYMYFYNIAAVWPGANRNNGFSVRCVADETE